jgi:hypothetical protein
MLTKVKVLFFRHLNSCIPELNILFLHEILMSIHHEKLISVQRKKLATVHHSKLVPTHNCGGVNSDA